MTRETILIVDDEAPIRAAVRTAFMREGINTEEAADGSDALRLLGEKQYSLVILDVMMENIGGFEVLQKMRAKGDYTPVMMLSGKSDEIDQVLGLGYGADSYLTKPFRISVLIQTAKALIRRNNDYRSENGPQIRRGPFTVNLLRMECYKNGRLLNLTGRELNLFLFLIRNAGQVFTKEQLYNNVWNDTFVDDNTITVYVKRIRDKIEDDPRSPKHLLTIRGIGYRFDE